MKQFLLIVILSSCFLSCSFEEKWYSTVFCNLNENEIYVHEVYADNELFKIPVGILIPYATSTADIYPKKIPNKFTIKFSVNGILHTKTIGTDIIQPFLPMSKKHRQTDLIFIYTVDGNFILKLFFQDESRIASKLNMGELYPDQGIEKYLEYNKVIESIILGDIDVFLHLMKNRAPLYWPEDSTKSSPIERAVLENNTEILKLIIDSGCHYPSYIIARAFSCAAQQNNYMALTHLLSLKNQIKDNQEQLQDILYSTVASNKASTEVLSLLLDEFNLSINYRVRDYGHTLLIVATQNDNVHFVKYLLGHGANKEIKIENGNKAIDFARNEEILSMLAEKNI